MDRDHAVYLPLCGLLITVAPTCGRLLGSEPSFGNGLTPTTQAGQSSEAADEQKQQTDPIAALSQIGVEDWFTPDYRGKPGSGNEVVFRDTVAFNLGRFDSITRLSVPMLTSS